VRPAVWDVDLGGSKEACIRWSPDPQCDWAIMKEKGEVRIYRVVCRGPCENGLTYRECRLGFGTWAQGIMY